MHVYKQLQQSYQAIELEELAVKKKVTGKVRTKTCFKLVFGVYTFITNESSSS